jgi:hypothetical protein
VIVILIIRIKGFNSEKDGYLLRIVLVLSSPHIVDYFYYRSNCKASFPITWLLQQKRYAISLFVLQCLTRPSFKIDHKEIESLLNVRELWPLLISKGIECRYFSDNLADLQEQIEFTQNNIKAFTRCLVSDNFKGFEQSLRWYVGSPPYGFSTSSKLMYEAYRNLEQATLLRLGESLPPFHLLKSKRKKQRQYRVGFALAFLMSGVEIKLVLETLDCMPENYQCVIIGLNDEKYSCEFEAALAEKNIELASIEKADVADVLAGIRGLDLDILFFCAPFWGSFLNRISLIAAARAAPMQIVYLGDVITSGLPSCDYVVLPSKIDNYKIRQSCTENLLLVPDNLDFQTQYLFETSAMKVLSNEDKNCVLYFSNAHMWKLNGDLIDVWTQILSQVERAVIRLAPLTTSYHKSYLPVLSDLIARKCKKWAISVNRFEIIPDCGAGLIQKQMAIADVYLDSFPYTGSVSLTEALVQSVPIVSLTGDSIPESLSRAILAQFNLEQDTLVTSVDTYVAKAIAFGRDAVLRKETSIKIREKIIQMNDRSGNRQFLTGFWNEIDKLLQSRM